MKSNPQLVLLAAVFLVAISGRVMAHSAVEPVPRPDDGWRSRQALLNTNAASAGEKARVVFIGDSITQGWEGAGKEVWARYYASRNAVNLGIGGDRTQHVLWRLENGNLTGLKPKAAVVMIGTNNSNGEDNSVEQIADGITAIVRLLRSRVPDAKVLLLPIFPRSENPSPQRGKILQVNQIIQKLADDESVFWVDFGHKFLKADGSIPGELMPDYLHLSPKGYEIWAASLEPRLAAVLGETSVATAGTPTSGGTDLTGDWVATMPGPNQEPIDMAFSLKQEGTKLIGKFERPDGGSLELTNGKIVANEFAWTIKRDRPDGGTMTYEMSGKVADGKLQGTARTELEGNPISLNWSGKRR